MGTLKRLVRLLMVALMLGATMMLPSYANEGAPPPEKPAPKKQVAPSNLVGNVVPRCDPGKVAGGNICKASPPGYYAPGGVTYALSCPAGSYSPAGSRALSECLYPDGRSAGNKFEESQKRKAH